MRRRVGFLLIFGSALSLAVASIAWACGNLTTLVLHSSSAAPGTVVTGEGNNWSNTAGTNVQVHLNTREGQVLWEGPPVNRRISPTITIPAGTAPGYYTLIATQYQSNGLPVSGSPGRARIQVTGGGAEPAADAAAPSDPAAGSTDSAAPAAAAPAAAAPAAATAAKKSTAAKKRRSKKARSASRKRKVAVAPWSASTPPSAPGRSEASAGAGGLAAATLPGVLVALVMLPTGLFLVRSRGAQRGRSGLGIGGVT